VLAGADHDRVDHQVELVEQALGEQEPDQCATAPTLMSPPGCCLIPVSVLATFLLISLVGPQTGSFIVVDKTIFGVLVIISPRSSGWP
jgi:hypothetical protein